jgi:hypothetical protein
MIYGTTKTAGTRAISKTLANHTATAVGLLHGGLFGDNGSKSDGRMSFLIGGCGKRFSVLFGS